MSGVFIRGQRIPPYIYHCLGFPQSGQTGGVVRGS